MRKTAWVSLLAVTLLLVVAAPGQAGWRHHHPRHVGARVFIGVGPAFVWGPSWYYYPTPYYYYYPPPYYYPPAVVVQEPPVYVQQQPAPPPAPPAEAFWYYCGPSRAYYPDVPTCTEPWIKVPAR